MVNDESIQRWQCYNKTWQSISIYNCCNEERVPVIVHGCVYLTQCERVAMSCHAGGLFKILWQSDCNQFMYKFVNFYQWRRDARLDSIDLHKLREKIQLIVLLIVTCYSIGLHFIILTLVSENKNYVSVLTDFHQISTV